MYLHPSSCKAKHLREVMAFQKNWNNEVITQFYVTLFVEKVMVLLRIYFLTMLI
jgi:hypothetical protein